MALLEVQIEGTNPWASGLPTWEVKLPLPLLNQLGLNGHPLTGYHTYLWLLIFTLPHFAFVTKSWSIKKEFRVISFFLLFTTLEAVFWFLVNPSVGISGFLPTGVDLVHQPWLALAPYYWGRLFVALILYVLANLNTD